MISSFYQYHSGCVFYYRRIARKAEAGRGGILRSINRSATCPAMWRLTFSGGGHLVRLSANGCQPHRPNTALIFCAAGYHPGLLRTFREHDLNCYYRIATLQRTPLADIFVQKTNNTVNGVFYCKNMDNKTSHRKKEFL